MSQITAFPTHITVKHLRQVIEHLADDAVLHFAYGEVETDLFARLDSFACFKPSADAATVPLLTVSLIDSEATEDTPEEEKL